MIIVTIFYGYQIKSKCHSSEEVRQLARNIAAILRKDNIDARADFGEFAPGSNIWEEVRRRVQHADVSVMDVSESNPNVLLEAGIAIGAGKHVIFLKCRSTDGKTPIPADLRAFVWQNYEHGKIGKTIVAQPLADGIVEYIHRRVEPTFYLRAFWGLKEDARTLVVPGRLPQALTGNRFEDFMRIRRLGDLDAVAEILGTLPRIYPRMDVELVEAASLRSLGRDWGHQNVVLVGGPDFNHVAKTLIGDECPLEYEYPGRGKVILRDRVSGVQWEPRFVERHGERVATDYGFVMCKPQHTDSGARIVVFGGARTWGVYGAARLVAWAGGDGRGYGEQSARRIVKKYGSSPSILVPVQVEGTEAGIREIKCDVDAVKVLKW